MYKISVYIPIDHAEKVKTAMFAAGAGKIGDYSFCSWECLGQGQFMPLEGSHAFIGEKNKVEVVAELKVELVCDDEFIRQVIAAMKSAHPYEMPAYHVIKTENF